MLGPAAHPPSGRLLGVRRVRSAVRFFDARRLALLRWVADRYLAPLATVIDRSHPPRVASAERDLERELEGRPAPAECPARADGAGRRFEEGVTTWLRPLPGEEAQECVVAVGECLAKGRQAIVLVPEAEPLPHTARAVLEAYPGEARAFLGGDARGRYRTWLELAAGRHRVVVGTRPAVFAPLPDVGLLWVSREVHPGHREDRSPYYHVREVAAARARIEGAACVLASLSPSVDTVASIDRGDVRVRRPPRRVERERAPLVETVAPEGEDRSVRLGRLLRAAGSAALIASRSGYGAARVCRSCRAPAACGACRGTIVLERGTASCRVCGAPGRCAACGGRSFGVTRGGTERVAEWAATVSGRPVDLAPDEAPPSPAPGRVLVGTAAAVKDRGPLSIDLVAILDPDRALVRPGLHAGERALATWMEAAAWAGSRRAGARVLAQTRRPGHPALQALIRWEPEPFLREEAASRTDAGFPPTHAIFRIEGGQGLEEALRALPVDTLLASASGDGTICLVAVRPSALERFAAAVRRLASVGVVLRVEAEPQL